MFGLRRLLALTLGLLILTTACGHQEPMETTHDLIADFPSAAGWGETRQIDFGSARGRRHLVSGWSFDEWDHPKKSAFVWGIGAESDLEFSVLSPRDLTLKVRCRPAPQVEGQRVDVILNGRHLDGFGLRDRLAVYQVQVDGEWLRPGVNELSFRYADHAVAGEQSGQDQRPLAVAWYELSFDSEVPVDLGEPEVIAEDTVLSMPAGTRVDYYLRLPPDSVLEVQGVDLSGGKTAHVEVSLQSDGEDAAHIVGKLKRSNRSQRLALEGDRSRVVRLTLGVPLAGDGSNGGALVSLQGPIIRSPQSVDLGAEVGQGVAASDAESRRPNILLYVMDTLRADHLGVYGYSRPVSPQIDAFATEATVFDDAVAQSSWTRASMASIFTSLWPLQHADQPPRRCPGARSAYAGGAAECSWLPDGRLRQEPEHLPHVRVLARLRRLQRHVDEGQVPEDQREGGEVVEEPTTVIGRSSSTCTRSIRTSPTDLPRGSSTSSPRSPMTT